MSACAPRATVSRSTGHAAAAELTVHLMTVPFYPDDTDQCGPSSLASILNFWGKNVTPAELKAEVYIKRLKGSLPMDMLPALEAHGLSGQIISGSFEDMKTELRSGRPLIAYLDFGTRRHPIGHYVVVTGYDDRRRGLYIHSSMKKDKFASYDRFDRGWKDTDHWLLLAMPATDTTVLRSTAAVNTESEKRAATNRAPRFRPALSADEYVQLGIIYASQGKKEEADAQYKLALEVDKRFAPAWIAIGNDAFESKNYQAAEKNFRRTLKIDPNNPAANNNLAMVYLAENRQLDRAEKLATKALSSNLQPYAYDTLAHIYLKRGDTTLARDAWKKAIASADGNEGLIHEFDSNINQISAVP